MAKDKPPGITAFFKALPRPPSPPPPPPPTRGPGRPRKEAAAPPEGATKHQTKVAPPKLKPTKGPVVKRTNWSTPENTEILREAVDGWLSGDAKAQGYTMEDWAATKNIPLGTFSLYVTPNLKKRLEVGCKVGRPTVLGTRTC